MSAAPARSAGPAVTAVTDALAGRRRDRRRRRRHLLPMVGAARLLAARTARRDALLLVVWALVVALAVTVAVGGPRLATRVVDEGAREAVAEAGRKADVVVLPQGVPVERVLPYVPTALDEVTLPGLRQVFSGVSVSVTGAGVQASALSRPGWDEPPVLLSLGPDEPPPTEPLPGLVEGTAVVTEVPFFARLALLPDPALVTVVEGELPTDADALGTVPVAMPRAAAEVRGVRVGDVVEMVSQRIAPSGEPPTVVPLQVVAIVDAVDPGADVWKDAGTLWTHARGEPVPVLAGPLAAASIGSRVMGPWSTIVRFSVDPEQFDVATASRVRAELSRLEVSVDGLLPASVQARASVQSDLGAVVDQFVSSARSAAAQMSVPTLGAAGTVALVLVLLARLVVERRRTELELERARGAAVATVVLRLGLEAVLVAAVATAGALAALHALLPGTTDPVALGAVLAAALLASPAWGGALARQAWSGSRVPANRRDRIRLARRRQGARVVLEAGALLVAAAAVVALRRRGLLQTTTLDTDPFLGAAPLLVALAAGVVALRLYPWPVMAAGALARTTRGALGVVGASRARRALRPLPLLVLTLAVAVGVSGLLLVSTVRAGQVRASWDVVGADAVVRTPDDVTAVAARLADEPGVTAVVRGRVVLGARADLGNRKDTVTAVLVDEGYPGTAVGLPGAGADVGVLAELPYGLEVTPPERGGERPTVGMVVSPELAARVGERGLSLWAGGSRTRVDVLGTTEHAPLGLGPGPYVFAALGTLVTDDGPLAPDVAWVFGPGAGDAVRALVDDGVVPADQVAVQADWLEDGRTDALVRGVAAMLMLGAAVAGVLAAIAAVATALAGARERGRTLALLRTLGMRPRLGWWLAGVELAPVVVAALLAGGAAGAAAVTTLGSSLGLDVLVGGVAMPEVTVDVAALAWVAAAGFSLLLVAVAVDALAHRRMRLAEVLRVGETPGS